MSHLILNVKNPLPSTEVTRGIGDELLLQYIAVLAQSNIPFFTTESGNNPLRFLFEVESSEFLLICYFT